MGVVSRFNAGKMRDPVPRPIEIYSTGATAAILMTPFTPPESGHGYGLAREWCAKLSEDDARKLIAELQESLHQLEHLRTVGTMKEYEPLTQAD